MRVSRSCFAVPGLGYVPPWTVNSGFVVGLERTLVIDTGANRRAAETIHGYATAAGHGNSLVVFNTERHFDHVGGNQFFREKGAEIRGHAGVNRTPQEFEAEVAEFSAAIPDDARRAAQEARVFYDGVTVAMPDTLVEEDCRIDLGGIVVDILLTPGHTGSNVAAFVASEGVLYTGDCVVNGYAPNLDCGGVPEWRAWLASLDRIEALAPSVIVPGHGAVLMSAESAREAIARVREVLEKATHSSSSPAAWPAGEI